MQVTQQQGIALFRALNYNATDAWTEDRLASKLNALPKLVDDEKKLALKKKDKSLSTLLAAIIKAKDGEEEITVAKQAAPKAAKGKPVPPADDEDDEELDEEEETDEEEEDGDGDDEGDDDDGDESEDDDDGDDEDDAESEDEADDEGEEEDDEEEAEEDAEDDDATGEYVPVAGDTVEHAKHGTCEVVTVKGDAATVKKANGKLVKGIPLDELEAVEEEEDDEDLDEDDEEDEDLSEDSEDEEDDDETDEEDEDVEEAPTKKPAAKSGKAKADPKATAKASAKPAAKTAGKPGNFQKAGDGKGPGVIGSIVEIVSAATKDKPIMKKDILTKLAKRFPDRSEEAMKATLNIQLPGRLRSEKGLNIQKSAEGGYYLAKGAAKAEAAPAKVKARPDAVAAAKPKAKK